MFREYFSTQISFGLIFTAFISIDGGRVLRKPIHTAPVETGDIRHNEHLESSQEKTGPGSLPFYGGAKNKLLLLSSSGKPTMVDRDSILSGTMIKEERNVEDDVGMEENSDGNDSSNTNYNENGHQFDGSFVGSPPENGSVAEAKPVGLAIAGPGGVASSKPVGTAIVGPGGLAVARPVATAIAGIEGAEMLAGVGAAPHQKRDKLVVPTSLTNEYQDESAATRYRREHMLGFDLI